MRAIVYDGAGDLSVIRERELTPPALKAGQIRVEVHASGVNRADLAQRAGRYPPPKGESDVPGLEVAGVVLESAPDARRFKKGSRVMALLGGGGYAEEVCVDERLAIPLPASLSFEEGAAIPEAFVTAHHNLVHLGGLREGKAALVHAGASGVGTAAIQVAHAGGCRVLATAGAPEKRLLCEKLGAVAINYRTEDFAEVALAHTDGRGVDVILDPVGGPYLAQDLLCLATGGAVVFIATMGGREAPLDIAKLMARRQRLIGSTLRALPLDEKAAAVARTAAALLPAWERKAVAPVMDRVFPASQAKEAQERMERNLNAGKLVLSWR